MQTQQINNVHVKVQCDNDFRRFVLTEVTYKYLVDTIRTLLGFAPTTILKLSYLDDEDDWVLFGSDGEFQYAATLSTSPLKISVEATETSADDSCPLTLLAKVTCAVSAEEKPWKWRYGREGREGRCKRRGECKGERINAKVARLIERHAVLTTKLIEGDLPLEKVRALEWRLSHLQNKIDSLKAKKEQLRDACAVEHQEKAPVAKTENDETMDEELGETKDVNHRHCHRRDRHRHARWGGHPRLHFAGEGHPSFDSHHFGGERHPHPFGHHFGGEGNPHPFRPHHRFGGELHPHHRGGCHRREKGERKPAFLHVCTAPEGKAAFDRLHAAKVAVVTARREKSSEEVIMVKIEELKEARAAWRELKMALWKEHKVQWENRHPGCPRKKLAQ